MKYLFILIIIVFSSCKTLEISFVKDEPVKENKADSTFTKPIKFIAY
jgi:hypothetical protein